MIKDNWLLAYASLEGMEKILYQMDRRTGFKSNMQYAIKPLIEHESVFENDFFSFFEDIRKFIVHQL
ncbi:ACP phosphodiesterase [Capnocytophaga canis]